MKISFKKYHNEYVNAMTKLVTGDLQKQQIDVSFLPFSETYYSKIRDLIQNLFSNGTGTTVWNTNEMVGFLAGFEVGELFGHSNGIYIPLYGHAAIDEIKIDICNALYQHMAETWIQKKAFSHAITVFANDKLTIDAFFRLGFGMRCVDALMETNQKLIKNENIQIRKSDDNDLDIVTEIYKDHLRFLRKSPLFLRKNDSKVRDEVKKWYSSKNTHVWMASKDGSDIGYLKLEPNGESFISEDERIMNITGIHVLENERKQGVAETLLATTQGWLVENGYPLCGVDYESINTIGTKFWNKHFQPYTASLTRRIDERVMEE